MYVKTVEEVLFSEVKNRIFSLKRVIVSRHAVRTVESHAKTATARQITELQGKDHQGGGLQSGKCFLQLAHLVERQRRSPSNPGKGSLYIAVTASRDNARS